MDNGDYPWPKLRTAIEELGSTNARRAECLGLSERQLWTWTHCGPPRSLHRTPSSVLRALADDIEDRIRLHHIDH
jgi:hypothetical protein